MKVDRSFSLDGTVYRIVIVGDVIAAPLQRWSDSGYGSRPIDACWLAERLAQHGITGRDAVNLNQCIRDAQRSRR